MFPKFSEQLVREKTNFLCLFGQDNTNLKHVCDMSFIDFRPMGSRCWDEDYRFLAILMTRMVNYRKYRKKIKDFLKAL
jgi:hypothetical protein